MSSSSVAWRDPWSIHIRSSEPDRWLDEMGYFRKNLARDSSCLFRAVSEVVYNTQSYHNRVRLECVDYIAANADSLQGSLPCSIERYVEELSSPSFWGGLFEVQVLCHLYRYDFIVFDIHKQKTVLSYDYGRCIRLFFSSDIKHFDVIYDKEYIKAASFCQSLVYEALYETVFGMKNIFYAVDKMLHNSPSTSSFERKKHQKVSKVYIETINDENDCNNNALALKCRHTTKDVEKARILRESLSIFILSQHHIKLENICFDCLDINSAKELLDNGITPFPYKVAKAMDPDIYRNIAFDAWKEIRREARFRYKLSDGSTLQVGVKCLCRLDEDQKTPFHCYIQKMEPNNGPCLVYVEELGEKKLVSYDRLELLPSNEIKPWAPPYRFSRSYSHIFSLSQMLHQIGGVRKHSLKFKSKSQTMSEDLTQKNHETTKKREFLWSEDQVETDFVIEEKENCLYTENYTSFQHHSVSSEIEGSPFISILV